MMPVIFNSTVEPRTGAGIELFLPRNDNPCGRSAPDAARATPPIVMENKQSAAIRTKIDRICRPPKNRAAPSGDGPAEPCLPKGQGRCQVRRILTNRLQKAVWKADETLAATADSTR